MTQSLVDRYVSFAGITCDSNADSLVDMLRQHLDAKNGSEQWHRYFEKKQAEQLRMNNDNLHFVGSQVNALFEFFKDCNDQEALQLLEKLEQECC